MSEVAEELNHFKVRERDCSAKPFSNSNTLKLCLASRKSFDVDPAYRFRLVDIG